MGISSPKGKFLISAYILRSTGWWVLKQVVPGPTDPMRGSSLTSMITFRHTGNT